MSHVAEMEVQISDLDALDEACKELGLELRLNQKTFKWYGTHVGDYPLPKGFSKEEMGKCDHAIAIPGNSHAYEIGVVKRRDGQEGYALLFDFFAGGRGMSQKVGGNNCAKLADEYLAAVTVKSYRRAGRQVQRERTALGHIVIRGR